MDWEKPRVIAIDMNAEIGAYQADTEDDPTRAARASEAPEASRAPASVQKPSDE